MHNSKLIQETQYDALDMFIQGLTYEIRQETRQSQNFNITAIGEATEKHVLQALVHECQLAESVIRTYCETHPQLARWYMTNHNYYADYFLEQMPISTPYITNPEGYACMWGNVASQIIGVVVGNIREDGC